MAVTYRKINIADVGGGSGGGSGTPFSQTFTAGSWVLSSGYYTITITEATHEKGTAPGVQVYEVDSTNFDLVAVDRIRINSLGDVEIRVPATPDLRFSGRVVILE